MVRNYSDDLGTKYVTHGRQFSDRRSAVRYNRKENMLTLNNGYSFLTKLLGGIFIFITIFMLFNLVSGNKSEFVSSMSAESFLEKVSNSQNVRIPTEWIDGIQIDGLQEEWAVFDGFRVFLNSLVDIVRFALLIIMGLLNVFTFVIGLIFTFFVI